MHDARSAGAQAGQWSAWALAALASVLAATAVALPLVGGLDYLGDLLETPEVVVAVSFSVTGAFLVSQRASRRIGWLLLAVGVVAALFTASASYTAYVLDGDETAAVPAGAELALATAWVTTWSWLPPWLLLSTVMPQVVPYGRPLPGWWRVPYVVALSVVLVGAISLALDPGDLGIFSGTRNPVGVEALGPVIDLIWSVLDLTLLALVLVALASVGVRLRRADSAERRQVGWVGLAIALTVVGVLLLPDPLVNGAVLLVPAGIAVAATRYRLYDLDLIVNRALVLVSLLGVGAVAYLALVGWVGALVGTRGGAVPFFVAFALALGFHPARVVVQRWVDRLFFGRRGDPEVLRRELDALLREAETPREALARGADFIAGSLRIPGVTVDVELPDGSRHLHQAGQGRDREPTALPLELHGERLGEVRFASRSAGGDLSSTDLRVLESLVGPLAGAAYALRLSGRLEESRRDLLATREDERRRLRRDLHDSLGPQLASAVMGLDVLRSSVTERELDRAEQLSTLVSAQVRTAVDEVRRLVTGLRPPVLDDLGLAGAIEVLLPTGASCGPTAQVECHGDLSQLPAAVEVAAYRIVAEAVTNALRHAEASRLQVRLAADQGDLELSVVDDGVGFGARLRHGVGLFSMQERAEELGGWCRITSDDAGTSVTARLPGVVR